MNVLFIHPNFPGQFRRLAIALVKEPKVQVYTLGDQSWMPDFDLPGAIRLAYTAPEAECKETHPYVQGFEAGVKRGSQVVNTLLPLKFEGFDPDIIYLHPGWGDGLYLKDLFPNAKLIGLFEYYYHARGADVGFDPEFPMNFDDIFRVRTMNALQHFALESCDIHLTPTLWQKSRYPAIFQQQMRCIHEGVNTDWLQPDAQTSFCLPNGKEVKVGDEVLTYVSRALEPYRGFHVLMRALPGILNNRPRCQVIIVGDDQPHYGPNPKYHDSWKTQYLKELSGQIDMSRVHFVGSLKFNDYLKILQISRVHVYLTYPFILSWSMLEAMSVGCLVLGSDTPPVREVIKHGLNGILFPFFDSYALVHAATDALAYPRNYDELRNAARITIQQSYDFDRVVYPYHLELLHRLVEPQKLPL